MPKSSNNNLPKHLKSTEQLQNYMQDVLKKAKQKGATDAEVSIDQDKGFSIDVRLKEVETVTFTDDQSVSIAVYLNKQKGTASTSELNPRSVDQLIDAALDIARVSAADPCFGLADKHLMSHEHLNLDLFHPWDIEAPEAIEIAKQCEEIALSQDPAIVNSDGVHFASYSGCVGYANTHGAEGVVYSSKHQISCSLVSKGKDNKLQRDYDYTIARRPNNLMSIEHVAKTAASRTLKRIDARKIKTQTASILFESRIASHLISSFLNAISGVQLYRKHTFLINSLNKQIFPSWFHLQEHPFILGALGSSPFDGEGVKTRDNIFVDEGVVRQYVLSSYTARRLGLETTANAGGVHNLTVKSNYPDFQSLLKTMDTGLLVTELMGQGINIQTGDYSRGASGFWVEKGVIQFPVEEITIAGNLKDMFAQIVGVGADVDRNRGMQCGSILVEKMMIAGE